MLITNNNDSLDLFFAKKRLQSIKKSENVMSTIVCNFLFFFTCYVFKNNSNCSKQFNFRCNLLYLSENVSGPNLKDFRY